MTKQTTIKTLKTSSLKVWIERCILTTRYKGLEYKNVYLRVVAAAGHLAIIKKKQTNNNKDFENKNM